VSEAPAANAAPELLISAPAGTLRKLRDSAPSLLHPYAIPITYILAVTFAMGVSPYAVLRSIAIALVGVTILIAVFTVILRDVHRAAIAVLLVYLLSISVATTALFILAVPTVVLVVTLDRLPRRRITWARINGTISTIVSILLGMILIQSCVAGQMGRAISDLSQGGGVATQDATATLDPSKPDIYVIVLDAYARPDTLLTSFGLDDGSFLSELRGRGFDVAANSHSNYPVTAETLVTMLNMDYLDKIDQVKGIHTDDPSSDGSYRQAINDNAVFRTFRGYGYEIVSTGSGWEQLAIRQSDVYLDSGQLNTAESSMLQETGLISMVNLLAPDWAADQARGRMDGAFSEIQQVAETASSKPRLVISHVLAPHAPFVYGPNGEHLKVASSNIFQFDWLNGGHDQQTRDAYAGQVAYVNSKVLPVVDAIIRSSRRPSVVILMSDHGSRLNTAEGTTMMSPEADDNFFAALTPGHPGLFGDSPTPVNHFRRLLNTYLGTSLPILADRSYLAPWGKPLELTPLPEAPAP